MTADRPASLVFAQSGDACFRYRPTERESEVLERINRKIAALDTLEQTIDFLFAETQGIMPCDRLAVAFFEDEGTRLTIHHVVSRTEPRRLTKGYSADIARSSLRRVFETGCPRIINDMDEYATAHPDSESARLILMEGIRANMTCPLTVDGRPVGVLFRSASAPGVYADREVALHLMIAERLSQAVEKAWRIEQLSSTVNAYLETLAFVTHELRSPLDSIATMGKTIVNGYLGPVDARVAEFVGRMVKKAEYLSGISNDYLNLARFESGGASLRTATVDFITDIVDEAIDIIRPQMEEQSVRLETDYRLGGRSVSCDPALMKTAMINLLGNAVKYGNREGVVRITATDDTGALVVSVWNEGPGFSVEDRARLFRRFSRLPKKELMARKGSGIGLYVTWKILQLHGGRIQAQSEEGRWAEFTFEIPLGNDTEST